MSATAEAPPDVHNGRINQPDAPAYVPPIGLGWPPEVLERKRQQLREAADHFIASDEQQ